MNYMAVADTCIVCSLVEVYKNFHEGVNGAQLADRARRQNSQIEFA